MLTFGGRYTDPAKSGNRKCPGQVLVATDRIPALLVKLCSCFRFVLNMFLAIHRNVERGVAKVVTRVPGPLAGPQEIRYAAF